MSRGLDSVTTQKNVAGVPRKQSAAWTLDRQVLNCSEDQACQPAFRHENCRTLFRCDSIQLCKAYPLPCQSAASALFRTQMPGQPFRICQCPGNRAIQTSSVVFWIYCQTLPNSTTRPWHCCRIFASAARSSTNEVSKPLRDLRVEVPCSRSPPLSEALHIPSRARKAPCPKDLQPPCESPAWLAPPAVIHRRALQIWLQP